MFYVLAILVIIFTIFGALLMTLSIGHYLIIIAGGVVDTFTISLFTQVAVSTLIVIVGLSSLMIVSAIRRHW